MRRPDRPLSRADMAVALDAALAAGVPALLWGFPGEGKTSFIEQAAERQGRHLEVVLGSIREPSDFAGLPMQVNDEARFVPPAWARRACNATTALVFFDELTTCAPLVQAAMLRVVQDGWVGDLKMPSSVAIVCAANPPEVAVAGVDLGSALANRFCHLWFEANAAEWTNGLINGWSLPAASAGPNPLSKADLIRWQSLLAAFIRRRPDLIRQFPKDLAEQGGPWASPRSWDMAVKLMAAADALNAPETVADALVSGCVGPGAAIEFLVYISDLDLPDPELLLINPAEAKPGDRADRTLALATAVVAAVVENTTLERWQAAWEVLSNLAVAGHSDIAAVAGERLARLTQRNWPAPPALKTFLPLLQRAGFTR